MVVLSRFMLAECVSDILWFIDIPEKGPRLPSTAMDCRNVGPLLGITSQDADHQSVRQRNKTMLKHDSGQTSHFETGSCTCPSTPQPKEWGLDGLEAKMHCLPRRPLMSLDPWRHFSLLTARWLAALSRKPERHPGSASRKTRVQHSRKRNQGRNSDISLPDLTEVQLPQGPGELYTESMAVRWLIHPKTVETSWNCFASRGLCNRLTQVLKIRSQHDLRQWRRLMVLAQWP